MTKQNQKKNLKALFLQISKDIKSGMKYFKSSRVKQNKILIKMQKQTNSFIQNPMQFSKDYIANNQVYIQYTQKILKMANYKKQFMGMYDLSVQLLRKFKQNNDSINKIIGVEHDSSISLKIIAQQSSHNTMMKQLDKLLEKLEQSYLDPDTARKIGTVKQQYKIQKDRRQHLMKSLNQAKQADNRIPTFTSQSQNFIKYTLANTNHYQKNTKHTNKRRNQNNDDETSHATAYSINRNNQEQVTQYDYEIECRLLQQKNKQLKQAERTLLNVYQITQQCKQMVDYQGEHLDIISDEIFKTKENVVEAAKELTEANQYSKKRRRKIFTFSLLIILATITILGIVLI